jgi:hypothetical protein
MSQKCQTRKSAEVPDARAIDPAVVGTSDVTAIKPNASAHGSTNHDRDRKFYGMLSGLGDTIQNNAKPPWSVMTEPDLRRCPLSGHGLAFGDNAEVSQALVDQISAGCSSRRSRYGAGCPNDDLYRRPETVTHWGFPNQ